MLRLFPHEVTDLEPVLSLLHKQDQTDCEVCNQLTISPSRPAYTVATTVFDLDVGDSLHVTVVAITGCHGAI